ncbi:MAG: hypothetical protein IH594_04725 [Bacteroidales bacterium]|nr:hypothetical protein [Bacteroidales bacterium]
MSQEKFEREYRIDYQNVPHKAALFARKCFDDSRIKWYAEESQQGKTIEAKTRGRLPRYSIEFDVDGTLLDVEKTVKFDDLELEVRNNINLSLEEKFRSYKVKKVQIQWIGSNETLIELISTGRSESPYNQNYELIVVAKILGEKYPKGTQLYEILLGSDGRIQKVSRIIPVGNDNLDF